MNTLANNVYDEYINWNLSAEYDIDLVVTQCGHHYPYKDKTAIWGG